MAKRGGFPGGMPGNMNNIMKQAQKMQKQMEEATKELQEKEVTSSAGGGVVEVTVSGNVLRIAYLFRCCWTDMSYFLTGSDLRLLRLQSR